MIKNLGGHSSYTVCLIHLIFQEAYECQSVINQTEMWS